jgi:hypothetical protein
MVAKRRRHGRSGGYDARMTAVQSSLGRTARAAFAALFCAAALAACATPAQDSPPPVPPPSPAKPEPKDVWLGAPSADPDPPAPPPAAASEETEGKDFVEEAKILFRVAACASDAPIPANLDARLVDAHCREVRPKIEAYKKQYVAVAKPFLTALLPPNLPDKVVYPFGGGDLVTALTTYPDAREITTLSLELPGDPRRVKNLSRDALEISLKRLRGELGELYGGEDYSRSETLKRTQRGDIPGELVLFLVGLAVHGFEPTSLRYFTLRPDGSIHYLGEREIAEAESVIAKQRKATWWPPDFSESFANAEIRFKPVGAPASDPPRIHRHLAQNLADEPLGHGGLLAHLEKKGEVAAMTKAASYLLWNDGFSVIRNYLLGHAVFMISDSTGVPPVHAARAGFVQETYGVFKGSLLRASAAHNRDFKKLWDSQPARKLPFRYGYLSGKQAHLVVMKRKDGGP